MKKEDCKVDMKVWFEADSEGYPCFNGDYQEFPFVGWNTGIIQEVSPAICVRFTDRLGNDGCCGDFYKDSLKRLSATNPETGKNENSPKEKESSKRVEPLHLKVISKTFNHSGIFGVEEMAENEVLVEARKAMAYQQSYPFCKCCGQQGDFKISPNALGAGKVEYSAYLICPRNK